MKQRSTLLPLTICALLLTYATLGGATPNGMLNPRHKVISLSILALLVVGWLLIRWRQRWKWYRTPLDTVIVLWIAVIGFSFVMNPDHWRRSIIGIWYVTAYIGIWFIVQDALANKFITRSILLKALLISGLPVVIFGLVELWQWFEAAWPAINAGKAVALPRLLSTLNNPNPLATFLFVLLLSIVSTILSTSNQFGRFVVILYGIITAVLLFFTGSRGGWLGAVIGIVAFVLLLLIDNPALVESLRIWWKKQSKALQMILTTVGILAIVIASLIAAPIILRYLTRGDNRPFYYRAAPQLLVEKPLTGHGLFTIGEGFLRLGSSPPNEIVGHAHNAVLNIAAELGIPGLLTLAYTVIIVFRGARHNWSAKTRHERMILIGASAALIGVAVHHMFDTTAMVAAISLTILVLLTLITAPSSLSRVKQWRVRLQPLLLTGLWAVLIAGGWWSNAIYTRYTETVLYGLSTGDYRKAAQDFQQVIDSDPAMPVYHLYQGFFFGLAANQGDTASAQDAIDAYLNFLEMEPYYAPGWMNLGALYWQVGAQQDAINAMQKAVELTPNFWVTPFILGTYLEQTGQVDAARQSYEQALQITPDASLYPEWQHSELSRLYNPLNVPEVSELSQITALLISGQEKEAQSLWNQITPDSLSDAQASIVGIAVALANGDRAAAQAQLELLDDATETNKWIKQIGVPLGTAMMLQFDGDEDAAQQLIGDLASLINPGYSTFSEDRIGEYASSQFWRVGIGNYALPQVNLPAGNPITRRLFEQLQQGFFKQTLDF